MRKLTYCAALLLAATRAALAQDLSTIQAHNERFSAAFNSGDFAAVARLYAVDARILPPGAEMMQGREAIQGYWTAAADTVGNAKLTAIDVKPMGESHAREIGKFTLKTKGDSPQEIVGKYVVIWQKEGEDWQIADDIWNTNN
jgi:uncharacterized protein (TIGR02246 family)